ncbi:MAG: succinate dehydrogenase, hydrophobic membrane anchor protein [Gammaproteobacteria bacterium]|jgi:succinate dehydrogenase / fumarate reductase membrane anchor subunit|nr:succinate dehydrogenase, hydrophobic membrane anchor protein [Gammaproteobacteria bacterium]
MSDPAQALSRVLGHGSAHEGAHHWRVQRVTAVALGVLVPWLLISLATLPDLTWPTVQAWMAGLGHAALLLLLVLAACWHSQLGVQVVIEDYVRGPARMIGLLLSVFLHLLLAAAGVLAVLRVALTAQP